ncbi:hypothetical protein BK635_04635 [Pseudomonas chlororaphis]|nr:hypothetical protein BK637_21520 [Pseudomonas chlororaphis]RON87815.1 hypothetical protein BK635_04635 [Pseudomonas chlororaphis]
MNRGFAIGLRSLFGQWEKTTAERRNHFVFNCNPSPIQSNLDLAERNVIRRRIAYLNPQAMPDLTFFIRMTGLLELPIELVRHQVHIRLQVLGSKEHFDSGSERKLQDIFIDFLARRRFQHIEPEQGLPVFRKFFTRIGNTQ